MASFSASAEHIGSEVVHRHPALWWITILLSGLVLCVVALFNGGPIYYPDTAAYLIDAEKLSHFHAPFAVRPIFYGLAIWPLHWGTFFFVAIYAQGLVVAHLVYLTARVYGSAFRPSGFLALIVLLTVFTPVSFHVSHLLPDIFVAVLILSLFLLGFACSALNRLETGYLLLLATAATSFHLTAVPVALAIATMTVVARLLIADRGIRPLLVVIPVVVALAGSLLCSYAIFQQWTLTPKNPPHLLARILADGPGREYLSTHCPQSGLTLCNYQDRLTSVEDDFLWRLLPSIPPADGYRIKAEAHLVLEGTIKDYPVEVLKHMARNWLRQLLDFQSETQVSQAEWNEFQQSGTPLAQSLVDSRQAHRFWEQPALDGINQVHAIVVLLSALVACGELALAIKTRSRRPAALIVIIAGALATNAFACGALGGVFGRYQGRVIWLMPLAAIVVGRWLWRNTASTSRQ